MRYISTRGRASALDFKGVLMAGLAGDGGLYMPEDWPRFSRDEIIALKDKPFAQVSFEILRRFSAGSIPDEELLHACVGAYQTFDHPDVCPLRELEPGFYLLELFHGPTLAFKDVAMQLLSRLMQPELQKTKARTTILGATSGDTGAAAVSAFGDMPEADVVILFPQDRISEVQRRQMTTSGAKNIHAIAIGGTFDDAQAIVKELFADAPLRAQLKLSAINSINWVRIAAQVSYYFTSALKLGAPDTKTSFSVPTGNFGDIFAGFAAMKMGLPIERLIVATNSNDILARALETGVYAMGEVMPTSSPSMDIQISSNFERLLYEAYNRHAETVRALMQTFQKTGSLTLAPHVLQSIRSLFDAGSASEQDVMSKINNVWQKHQLLVDPHTAVGLCAAQKFNDNRPLVTLSTAHPAKFHEAVEAASGQKPALPAPLEALYDRAENYAVLPAQSAAVKAHMQKVCS